MVNTEGAELGQVFVVGSVSCLFVMVAKLACLVQCLKPALLTFPYARCEDVGAGCCHGVAGSGELFCWLSQFFVHWGCFLRIFIAWVHINKPWDFWCFLRLFCCGPLFILSAWACINKLWYF